MLDTLTFDQLRLFLTVAEEGSFSGAGRRLNRVPSAVGYGISKLEENLGIALFERSGRTVALTPEGRSLLPEAEAVFEQVGRLRQRADRLASRLEPHVTVAVEALLPADFVLGLCTLFRAQFPNVSLHLRTEGLGGVAAVVLDGSCDLGVSGDYDLAPNLRSRLLGHLPTVAVVAQDHPLAALEAPVPVERLRHEAQVLIAHSRYGSAKDLCVLSEDLLSVAGADMKLGLIQAGFGWGFVPQATVQPLLESGELVALHLEDRGAAPQRIAIHGIVRRDAQLGPATQWLFDALVEQAEHASALDRAA